MLKRLITLLLSASLILCIVPFSTSAPSAIASELDFGDRILYGGYAVDIGDEVYFSENGSIWRQSGDNAPKLVAPYDANSLNYHSDRLWFIADNAIISCKTDGSDMQTHFKSESSISCLYVLDNQMLYLNGSTVYSLADGKPSEILTRDDIKGFVPLADGTIRWVKSNPDYTPVDESTGEVFEASADEFISYIAYPETEESKDILYGSIELTSADAAASSYTGPFVKVGSVTLPLDKHMPGTFFSKNGEACTCHGTSSNYCINSVGNCNCMRYYPTGIKETCEIDLLGAQCFAFSRMVFYTCFGFIDHPMNASLYYNVGSIERGTATANSVKKLFMKAGAGAHIRLSSGHSVSLLTADEDFVVIYHGNAGGNGVTAQPCIVSTRRYTWEEFANGAAAKGIDYVNMPYNHPDSSVILTEKEVGYYRLNSNLNLRAETNTQSASLTVIPKETIISVTAIDGFWGKTSYNGFEGWVFLEYTTFYTHAGITPSGNTFSLGSDGYLRGTAWELDFETFSEHFDRQSLVITAPDGSSLADDEQIGTGYTVSITVDGKVIDKATVCIAGDVNRNSKLDVGDFLVIRKAVLGSYTLASDQKAASEVSGDNKINAYDYMLLKSYFFTSDETLFDKFK